MVKGHEDKTGISIKTEEIEGATCDICGNTIGPYGCCGTIQVLQAKIDRMIDLHGSMVTLYGWPDSQVCVGCPNSRLVDLVQDGSSSDYICLINKDCKDCFEERNSKD